MGRLVKTTTLNTSSCTFEYILKCKTVYRWANLTKDSPHILALYNYLDEIKLRDNITKTDVVYSIAGNSIDVLRYFIKKKPKIISESYEYHLKGRDTFELYDLYSIATIYKQREILQLLESISNKWDYRKALEVAPLSNDLSFVKHISNHVMRTAETIEDMMEPMIKNAALVSSIEIIDWLLRVISSYSYEITIDAHGQDIVYFAIVGGHLKLIQHYFSKRDVMDIWCNFIDISAEYNRFDILKYIHSRDFQYLYPSTLACEYAAGHGNLEMLIWLNENIENTTFSENEIYVASQNGHLSVVKWLHENRTEGFTSSAMDIAAYNGHIDIVKWLHQNRTEGCTTNAIDQAAQNGNLEMVKWLHENRTEGCTNRAMDYAAKYGHIDVIKWLHQNRTEGFTTDAMSEAVKNGNLDIIKWLQENFTGYYPLNLEVHGIFDPVTIKWLQDNKVVVNQVGWMQTIFQRIYRFCLSFYLFFNRYLINI